MDDTSTAGESRSADDRERLAREAHDAVSQTLFAANLVAGTLARDPQLSDTTRAQVKTLERLNHGALAELRMLRLELEPAALRSARLADLLRHAAAAWAARGEFSLTCSIEDVEPPAPLHVPVYRIAQEALADAVHRGSARHVELAWTRIAPARARLAVADDGQRPADAPALPRHAGVHKMREHAASLGTELTIRAEAGRGTRVEVEIGWKPSMRRGAP
jgi:signal transduction histidine kinase